MFGACQCRLIDYLEHTNSMKRHAMTAPRRFGPPQELDCAKAARDEEKMKDLNRGKVRPPPKSALRANTVEAEGTLAAVSRQGGGVAQQPYLPPTPLPPLSVFRVAQCIGII